MMNPMPGSLFLSMLIEVSLIVITWLFFAQPKILFGEWADQKRDFLRAGGVISLCIMFCWSFLVGCVLALHQMSAGS